MTPSVDLDREQRAGTPVPSFTGWAPSDTLRRQLFIRCLAKMVRIALEEELTNGCEVENHKAEESCAAQNQVTTDNFNN